MRQSDHRLILADPNADPVSHGVAQGLAEMFPLVGLSSARDEQDEQIEEDDPLERAT